MFLTLLRKWRDPLPPSGPSSQTDVDSLLANPVIHSILSAPRQARSAWLASPPAPEEPRLLRHPPGATTIAKWRWRHSTHSTASELRHPGRHKHHRFHPNRRGRSIHCPMTWCSTLHCLHFHLVTYYRVHQHVFSSSNWIRTITPTRQSTPETLSGRSSTSVSVVASTSPPVPDSPTLSSLSDCSLLITGLRSSLFRIISSNF